MEKSAVDDSRAGRVDQVLHGRDFSSGSDHGADEWLGTAVRTQAQTLEGEGWRVR